MKFGFSRLKQTINVKTQETRRYNKIDNKQRARVKKLQSFLVD